MNILILSNAEESQITLNWLGFADGNNAHFERVSTYCEALEFMKSYRYALLVLEDIAHGELDLLMDNIRGGELNWRPQEIIACFTSRDEEEEQKAFYYTQGIATVCSEDMDGWLRKRIVYILNATLDQGNYIAQLLLES